MEATCGRPWRRARPDQARQRIGPDRCAAWVCLSLGYLTRSCNSFAVRNAGAATRFTRAPRRLMPVAESAPDELHLPTTAALATGATGSGGTRERAAAGLRLPGSSMTKGH